MTAMPNERLVRRSYFSSKFLDTVGDQSGSINMAVDGSVSPVYFFIQPDAGHVRFMNRIIVQLTDGGTMDSGGFGNSGTTPLTNGVIFGVWKDDPGVFIPATDQLPIKKNLDFAAFSYDISHDSWGSGDEGITARYDFRKDGAPIVIQPGFKYAVKVQDDLTYLSSFTIRAGSTQARI